MNRVTRPLARAGVGPWSLVRHVGRRSGRTYETPLLVARRPDGFVIELTYGTGVDWYRNIVAAGHCVIVNGGTDYPIDDIRPCSAADGRAAYAGRLPRVLLRLVGSDDFRFLHIAAPGDVTAPPPSGAVDRPEMGGEDGREGGSGSIGRERQRLRPDGCT